MDEAKALLKRELENRQTAARSDEEFARLLSEVGQLNLVRESNAHLRNDNEELYKKLQVGSSIFVFCYIIVDDPLLCLECK